MKKISKVLLFGVVAAAVSVTPTYAARAKKSASPSPAPSVSASPAASATSTTSPTTKAPRSIPFHGKIASVDAKASTFTIAGKEKSRTFKITNRTMITKAGAAATMKDVVPNEEARGSYWKMNDGSLELRSLKLGPLTEAEKAVEEKRKERRATKKAAGGAAASPSPASSPSASPAGH